MLDKLPLDHRRAYIRLFGYKLEQVDFSVDGFLNAISVGDAIDYDLCKLLGGEETPGMINPSMIMQLCEVYGLGDELGNLCGLWADLRKFYRQQWFHLAPYSEQDFKSKMYRELRDTINFSNHRNKYYAAFRNTDTGYLAVIVLQYVGRSNDQTTFGSGWDFCVVHWSSYIRAKCNGSTIRRLMKRLTEEHFFNSSNMIAFNR